MARVSSGLWRSLVAVQVYGANTNVGKTIFSTLLGAHLRRATPRGRQRWSNVGVHYIKPVSTGPADEADDSYVKRYVDNVRVTTLFKFQEPVSPHIAVRSYGYVPSDEQLVKRLYAKLKDDANLYLKRRGQLGLTIVETAGGVLSPGPSGAPQADIFRPMRLPVVLVGDHRLGGIASTISAAESLMLRGYDISAVICFDDKSKYQNAEYLLKYFGNMDIPAFEIPWIPDLEGCSPAQEHEFMSAYYNTQSVSGTLDEVARCIIDRHFKRLANVNTMAARTHKSIWHPFTQHRNVKKADDILVFDSAYGDYFQTKRTDESRKAIENKAERPLLYPAFDGSASWWTQGLGHGNPQLSLAAAYAAGRYGHVMFAGATHEPAITLAETLLKGMQNPRLQKCFYTDDGSTAVEVGIKMALRATCKRYEWDGSKDDIGILGLKGSYHGDTIGAMDASEPCVFNKNVDWYRGRGYWFDYPTVKMRHGKWLVEAPAGMEDDFGEAKSFEHLDDVFDFDARGPSEQYETYIQTTLDKLVKQQGRKFGALVMEPILLGAGGMIFVDPLFQRTLVNTIRSYPFTSSPTTPPSPPSDPHTWTGLPILFDEVFTGLHRLGPFTPSTLLRTHPDITTHAKLLTGGLIPLSATLTSPSIFAAFLSPDKADALLHGHSYTAHPIGCHVANQSLKAMAALDAGHAWKAYKRGWKRDLDGAKVWSLSGERCGVTWSMWRKGLVVWLSRLECVDYVVALGSVLAVSLKDGEGAGYTSSAAVGLRDGLLNDADVGDGIKVSVHSRVLGNVLYLMASLTSKKSDLDAVGDLLKKRLGLMSGISGEDGEDKEEGFEGVDEEK